ncbi:MFS transporter [Cupriavidus necator]|uniref:MFS transporter n=1 Tax=Cupriavidus necator TaxID=106590 RepID=UPI0009B7F1B9|nr:aromatic acid/H+ symport family MFS transporter [Cupriavidus necator]
MTSYSSPAGATPSPPGAHAATTTEIDVQDFIDSHKFSGFQWIILVLCFLILAADGFDTAAIGFIAPALVKQWGVSKSALGPVMSAALFGLAAGALLAGPLADRIGRKIVLVVSILWFGGWSLASATAGSIEALTVMRFLTGIGLGAAMPNAVTLMSEYSPAKRRGLAVNTMFCGFTLGASAGGFVAAWLIPEYGWTSVLVVGGVAPLLLAIALVAMLPESVRFMVTHHAPAARIAQVLARIAPARLTGAETFVVREQGESVQCSPLGQILSHRFALSSVMLWVTYFMGLLVFYLLTSWLPTLITDTGLPIQSAAIITALFPLGGCVGTVATGWLMDRSSPYRVVALAYAVAGVLIFTVGYGAGSLVLLGVLVFGAGICMNGAQSSMPTLAAAFYPTNCRATGVSWMLGMGRFGGISGALLGAQLVGLGWSFTTIFGLLAVPALVASLALLATGVRNRNAGGTLSVIEAKV